MDVTEIQNQLVSLCDTQSRRWTAPRDKMCRSLCAQLESMGASLEGLRVVDEPADLQEKTNRFNEDEEVRRCPESTVPTLSLWPFVRDGSSFSLVSPQ